jgi:hypothetical protein
MQNQALTGYEFEQQLKHKEFCSVGRALARNGLIW